MVLFFLPVFLKESNPSREFLMQKMFIRLYFTRKNEVMETEENSTMYNLC